MLQSVIVYIVVAIALGITVYYIWRRLRVFKNDKPRDGCSDCPLKNNCRKITMEDKDCSDSCGCK